MEYVSVRVDMVMCAFHFYCLPGVLFIGSKIAKWILSGFSPWVWEGPRLVLLGKLRTARRELRFWRAESQEGRSVRTNECHERSVVKTGWLGAFQEDLTMSIDCGKS